MRKLAATLLALTLLPAVAPAATLCEPRIGFTADRTLVLDGRTYQGKIWAMPGQERHEQAISAFHPIFLLKTDRPLGQAVLPQLKTIVEFVMPPELRLLGEHGLKKQAIGEETINGVATTKYAVEQTVPEGRASGTLWLSRDGIPMKLAGVFTPQKGKPAKVRWELTHLKIGPQPAALFEPPSGYSKLPAEAVAPLLGLKLKGAGK